MSKAFTTGLTVLAACALFGCSGGGYVTDSSEPPSTSSDGTEPTLFAGDTTSPSEDPRVADDRGDLAKANGAVARVITFNHPTPHELVIPATDMISGRDGTFTLSHGGGAFGVMHTHDVTLTARQLGQIADGAMITVESTPGGAGGAHTHSVTIVRR